MLHYTSLHVITCWLCIIILALLALILTPGPKERQFARRIAYRIIYSLVYTLILIWDVLTCWKERKK